MAGWRVRSQGGEFVVVPPDGSTLEALLASSTPAAYRHPTRRLAIEALVAAATTTDAGLLPEEWSSDAGIAFAEPTGPERDFSQVQWTWRDPAETLVPLMLQQVSAPGHDEAELAGFVSAISESGGTVAARGRFYANTAGREFRDLLLGGRRFGVSVDPGENTAAEWICTSYDADGFCDAGRMSFSTYEIAGLTGTPFPGFARASIMLAAAAPVLEPALVAGAAVGMAPTEVLEIPVEHARILSGSRAGLPPRAGEILPRLTVPSLPHFAAARGGIEFARPALRYDRPPVEFFRMAEPDLGGPNADLLVEQEDGTFGVPLTITDEGAVFGHVARWGQCHTGYPDECVQAPPSRSGYAGFHLGLTVCAGGEEIPSGVLTAGCDHAPIRMRAPQAREHYDHSGVGWATARLQDAQYGIWCAGALRPDVTDAQVDLLRSLSMSGDWRRDRTTGLLEALAVLAVNVPGFPQRRHALAASAGVGGLFLDRTPVVDQVGAFWQEGELEALVASGMVVRSRCGCSGGSTAARLEALEAALADRDRKIEALTRLTVRRP